MSECWTNLYWAATTKGIFHSVASIFWKESLEESFGAILSISPFLGRKSYLVAIVFYALCECPKKGDADDEGVKDDDYMIPGKVDLNESEKAFWGICPPNERVRQAKPACITKWQMFNMYDCMTYIVQIEPPEAVVQVFFSL